LSAASAERSGVREAAAIFMAQAVLREAGLANRQQVRMHGDAAPKLSRDRHVQAMTALAFALAGDPGRAEALAVQINKSFPVDTLAQHYWLPTIRAALELQHRNANRALEILQAVRAYELGTPMPAKVIMAGLCARAGLPEAGQR
jgi:hypothetical protein